MHNFLRLLFHRLEISILLLGLYIINLFGNNLLMSFIHKLFLKELSLGLDIFTLFDKKVHK